MTDTDQNKENEVLKRMLKAPPKPHKSDRQKNAREPDVKAAKPL